MEKNKQYLEEDVFLRKYLKEIELDKTKSDFTANIMDVILANEKQAVLKSEPLISKKIWVLAIGFIATCVLFLINGKSDSNIEFPIFDINFFSKFQIPNLLEQITVSNTMFYAIVIFSLMVFVQIFYLKRYYNKRFE